MGRELLAQPEPEPPEPETVPAMMLRLIGKDITVCERCEHGPQRVPFRRRSTVYGELTIDGGGPLRKKISAAEKFIKAGMTPCKAAKQLNIGRATACRIARSLR